MRNHEINCLNFVSIDHAPRSIRSNIFKLAKQNSELSNEQLLVTCTNFQTSMSLRKNHKSLTTALVVNFSNIFLNIITHDAKNITK